MNANVRNSILSACKAVLLNILQGIVIELQIIKMQFKNVKPPFVQLLSVHTHVKSINVFNRS